MDCIKKTRLHQANIYIDYFGFSRISDWKIVWFEKKNSIQLFLQW